MCDSNAVDITKINFVDFHIHCNDIDPNLSLIFHPEDIHNLHI